MNEFTEKSVLVGMMTLLSAVLATVIYFLLSSITYGLLVAMPSIASLSTVATYFATIGVIGLSCALVIFAIGLIISAFAIANWANEDYIDDVGMLPTIGQWFLIITVVSLVVGILSSLGFSIPFFISILCGAPAFIISSFLSVSAANISFLTAGALIVSAVALLSIMRVTNQGYFEPHDIRVQWSDPGRSGDYQPNHLNDYSGNQLLDGNKYYPGAFDSKRPASVPYDIRNDSGRMSIDKLVGTGNNLQV